MSETQSGRVGFDLGVAERRHRRVRSAYPQGGARFVTGVAVIVTIASATFGVQAYVRAGHEQSRVAALEAEVTGLEGRLTNDERAAAAERSRVRSAAAQARGAERALARFDWALQSVPSEAQVAGVRNELAAYASCIPQLQSEIAGMSLSWRIDSAKPATDSFKLGTTAPISAACSTALSGR
jgi:hypothetical protein